MATIYVLSEPSLYDAETLTALLEEMSAGRYGVEAVPSADELLAKLEESRQAVVFFSAPAIKLVTFVQQCRSALPGTAFVAVVSESDVTNIPVFETDCHFLLRPYDAFQVMSQLASAVRQSELMAAIADGSHIDEVTNLFSRRYFLQRLSEEISLSKRHLSPLCCVVVGVSMYQIYLDSYGYDFINALLRYLSDQINGMTRHEDITARIGDNEIAILLPRSTEKGAKVFTSRLIQTLNLATFKYGGYVEEVNVSAGVAGYPLADGTPGDADTMVRYARHALHQARCSEPDDEPPVRLFSEIKPVI
jgi:diguanylate cyclase (GGDEF)-like protein